MSTCRCSSLSSASNSMCSSCHASTGVAMQPILGRLPQRALTCINSPRPGWTVPATGTWRSVAQDVGDDVLQVAVALDDGMLVLAGFEERLDLGGLALVLGGALLERRT